MTTPTIAFIGTGIMGKPMAINLQKAGYSIVVSYHFCCATSRACRWRSDSGAQW